ncbi:hypothetical protein [Schaalia canis]|uniref:Uncharacterized protein n=1 Tax=Schaalia canis TaxID=100469 RepID=A0A3P1SEF6_9ACTO|nr:hypothetical protein [Schaalia canis]RRC95290.1 hypothetical protein EII11_06550 [Schaalia canis]
MFKIFTVPFTRTITRPSPLTLTTAAGALATALTFPAIIPNTSYFFLAVQALSASGTFIAGAHRNHAISFRALVVLPLIITAISIRHYPLNTIPALLLCYAFYVLGNAWKYWYLQQDPNRHNPNYRYFKDPNTRPQQHIIYALFLTPPVFLVGGATLVGLEGLGLYSSTVGSILLALLMGGCLLFALIHLTLGIVQLIRRALRRRAASTHPEHA